MKTTYFAPSGGISKIAGNIPLHDFFKVSKKIIEQPINIDLPHDINNTIEVEDIVVPMLLVITVFGVFYYLESRREEVENKLNYIP